jgi:hypothetical protein
LLRGTHENATQAESRFVAALFWNCYIRAMKPVRPMPASKTSRKADAYRILIPGRIVLKDHERLPGRFFGRLTATAQAGL